MSTRSWSGGQPNPSASSRFAPSVARDKHLLKILLRAKTSARPYLIVYGGGHCAALRLELERAFGPPTIQSFDQPARERFEW